MQSSWELDAKRLSGSNAAVEAVPVRAQFWFMAAASIAEPVSDHFVIQWGLDDVRDNCTSYQAFEHYQRFGMGEENTPMYLCRDVTFDIEKIWRHSHR
jgi:hypothetical protein